MNKLKFLTVARVLYDKGFCELVQAASILNRSYGNIEFQWLGAIDTGYAKFVAKDEVDRLHERGIINYLGFQKDVREYMRAADCIVLPSYHEGMSRVLMESLALRKPIITTNIPGCRELVDDGINGYLCEPRDVGSLACALEKFMKLSEEERIRMGEMSREKAEAQFDVKSVIAIYESIIAAI